MLTRVSPLVMTVVTSAPREPSGGHAAPAAAVSPGQGDAAAALRGLHLGQERVCSYRGHIFYQRLPGGARHDGGQRVLSADGLHSTATRQGGRGPGRGAQHGVHLGQVVVGCTPHHHTPGQDLPEVQFSSFGWP